VFFHFYLSGDSAFRSDGFHYLALYVRGLLIVIFFLLAEAFTFI